MDAPAQTTRNTNSQPEPQSKKKKCSGTCDNCKAKRLAKLQKETTSTAE